MFSFDLFIRLPFDFYTLRALCQVSRSHFNRPFRCVLKMRLSQPNEGSARVNERTNERMKDHFDRFVVPQSTNSE